MVLRQFLRNESGATAIEYALLAALISIAIIGGATAVGTAVSSAYEDAASGL